MRLQLIRHATLRLEYNGQFILVDPMLSDMGVNPPISGSANTLRNPMVPLPFSAETLPTPDLVIVTHLHTDHWDLAAQNLLPKNTELLCQPGNECKLSEAGFYRVTPVASHAEWEGIRFHRMGGRHGTGIIGKTMGKVSGFVLKAAGEPTIYIAGDTIYCDDVERALDEHRPDLVIVNAGGARFKVGDPITMTPEDVLSVCKRAPNAKVVAVHMDTINHCLVTREQLRSILVSSDHADQVLIPEDGEWL